MARPLRIAFAGAFYHVYTRGLEGRELYRDAGDYKKFLKILTEVQKVTSFICHTYCLMPNHYHLYVETPFGNLSKIMQEVNGRYTQYYNWRYRRVGPLYQGRYKAKLIDKEAYSLQLCRYIHLNPVKGKLVKVPEAWEWSSYGVFLGDRKCPDFLQTAWLMNLIGNDERGFERFTREGLGDAWDPLESQKGGPVLGSEPFVKNITREFVKKDRDASLTGLRDLKRKDRVEEVERWVEGLECEQSLRKKLLIYGLKRFTGLRLMEIGEKVGGMKPVAVSQAVRRFQNVARRDPRLATWIEKLECQM